MTLVREDDKRIFSLALFVVPQALLSPRTKLNLDTTFFYLPYPQLFSLSFCATSISPAWFNKLKKKKPQVLTIDFLEFFSFADL
jgi:hypothetical protein